MDIDFNLRKGDRLPLLTATLLDPDGDAVDLTTATGVIFQMRAKHASTLKVSAAASVLSPATAGRVQYAWAAADVDTEGLYEGTFEVTWTGGKTQTVPTAAESLIIQIHPAA